MTDDMEKSTTKNDQEGVRRARKCCNNSLKFAATLLCRRQFRKGVLLVSKSTRSETEQSVPRREC